MKQTGRGGVQLAAARRRSTGTLMAATRPKVSSRPGAACPPDGRPWGSWWWPGGGPGGVEVPRRRLAPPPPTTTRSTPPSVRR